MVDDESLFSDEQKFFNLAEELEKELGEEPAAEESSEISTPQGEVSLEEIFREFKKGVEQQLSAEDYETHFNLGIAYKEMGLIDEAIGEFQLASKDPGRVVECCSMLGHCFLEKGMPQLAIKWFRKGLESPGIEDPATAGMLYDLAQVYQDTGDTESAYRTFQEVYGRNANYRDVVRRVKELDANNVSEPRLCWRRPWHARATFSVPTRFTSMTSAISAGLLVASGPMRRMPAVTMT